MTLLADLILALLLMAVIEYALHRHTMHRPTIKLLDGTFRRPAILHHLRRRNDINIDLDAPTSVLVASPFVVVAWLLGFPGFALTFLAVAVAHGVIWTRLHRCFHGVGAPYMARLPGYGMLLDHHLAHHKNPT